MASTIKLSAVAEPALALDLPDGTAKTYPLWATLRKLEAEEAKVADAAEAFARRREAKIAKGEDPGRFDTVAAGFDAVRRAFDFPTEAEAGGAFTLSDQMAFAIKAALLSDLQELPEAKKLSRT